MTLQPCSRIFIPGLFLFSFWLAGCNKKEKETFFSAIDPVHSGIDFENTINETETVNLITNEYTYMGGGVGIGDFNNDGLADIFFTANQASSRLYINKGDFKFEDISQKAGIATTGWCTGVSVVDINQDGWQDIYVSISGPVTEEQRKNLLFINNRNLTFTEMAASYGLDDNSHSTQAAFFDYDKDGLLDMFLLTHQMEGESMNKILPKVLDGSSSRNDKLFHNEGIDNVKGHPVFKEVTMPTGIRDDGYGLGVVISDFNEDNWPDVYVSNDYIGNDCMWLNNKDGSFTNIIARSLNHQSYSSMGTDAADINNDGLPDIITLDMMPHDNYRKKMMYSILNNERHQLEKYHFYEPSFMQNTLQLNRGIGSLNDTLLPVFSDIAYFAGVAETDWSWSVLAADFTNDGYRDLHITNGMGRDMINSDFVNYRSAVPNRYDRNKVLLAQLASLGPVLLPNYFYTNDHNYGFRDESGAAGINEKTISNGAAYSDLDNDGDLDLVINNINSKASVFENNRFDKANPQTNYLRIQLNGPPGNADGLGTRVHCFVKDSIILLEQNPVRGYLSTMDNRLFTGLGYATNIDSIRITWPDDKVEVISNVPGNRQLTIKYADAKNKYHTFSTSQTLFLNYTGASGVDYKHTDPFFFDYYFQRLLPQKFSSLGPGIAVGDVNNDGLDDFFVGNGYNLKGKIFIQQPGGRFKEHLLETGEKIEEDTGSLFFDADGDGDADLLVTSGTSEFEKGSPYNLPRLYTNDGKGNFTRNLNALPAHLTGIITVVKATDIDQDGDLDLFLGGRLASGNYPAAAPSYLLRNNRGIFTDVTQNICPALLTAGMVTDAAFADLDGDAVPEMIIAGEWMPIRIFKNKKGQFNEITNESDMQQATGMWRSLALSDLDGDGDQDIVAGNIGFNQKFQFSQEYPLNLWYMDIDGNGSIDPVTGYYLPSETGAPMLYPARSLTELTEQVPALKKRYLLHKDFAAVTMEQLFDQMQPAKLIATEAATCWFENDGKGKFIKHHLPAEAQFAPVNDILVYDFDNDGYKDMLIAGNEYQNEVMTGYFDGSYGLLLKGNKHKSFSALPLKTSGIYLRGDTRSLELIFINNKPTVIAGINSAPLQLWQAK